LNAHKPVDDADWNVCIDFGTAFSKAAAAPARAWENFKPQTVRPLALSQAADGARNPFMLTSAIFVGKDHIFFDWSAIEQSVQAEDNKRQALASFKVLLGAGDLERALNAMAPATIDPHRMFRHRRLIVLYLAYLLRALDRAIAADPMLAGARINRRYACPAWGDGFEPGQHAVIVRLFDEADHVRRALGDQLAASEGVPLKTAMDALENAQAAPAPATPTVSSMIYEATAASACASIGQSTDAAHLVVLDVGAGTTDIAALAHIDGAFIDLPEARITLDRAGDFIDRVLLNLIIERGLSAKGPAEQARLWRILMRSIRKVKETLCIDHRAAVQHEGKVIVITTKDLAKDADYKAFVREAGEAFLESVEVAARRAVADGRDALHLIAAGGGAAAPFVQDIFARAPAKLGKVRITQKPATPNWAHDPAFAGNLAPFFPQLMIAMGGALAPDRLLAAR